MVWARCAHSTHCSVFFRAWTVSVIGPRLCIGQIYWPGLNSITHLPWISSPLCLNWERWKAPCLPPSRPPFLPPFPPSLSSFQLGLVGIIFCVCFYFLGLSALFYICIFLCLSLKQCMFYSMLFPGFNFINMVVIKPTFFLLKRWRLSEFQVSATHQSP